MTANHIQCLHLAENGRSDRSDTSSCLTQERESLPWLLAEDPAASLAALRRKGTAVLALTWQGMPKRRHPLEVSVTHPPGLVPSGVSMAENPRRVIWCL
mmetsp:Transcript_121481/g.288714  ORF Transcript_121481/g.288714 Transcript_121481/m.288714 type:complete len:99 (+) Transcript_121481:52-348(+)|eukprot:CAMPEP_0181405166 /NCGR_PEP_ID=MMETSP1110-20121109/4622_1 /TAXON_ID=174948 /ORGANISM="Symbiodinium sp., Strain CCMP421" /LENGTH=98 /DNA_ID=CAMNT_0023527551 /DNA_START=51 /DNA_END=347 /DNA_ORIENTATION=+